MSFRTKVFLSIAATAVVSVWIVAAVVSALVSDSFERRDAQRTAALVDQFQREFDRRGAEVARRIEAVANSDAVQRVALNPSDTSAYFTQAQALAQEQSLDFLELVGPDQTIISSAEWPARFGYKEDWLAQPVDWKSQGVFLKREDLADGEALGLIAVRTVKAGEGTLYVVGGWRLDQEFLDSLPGAEGMRVLLSRQPREATAVNADTITTLPLRGRDNQLLATLLIENSRADLVALKKYIQGTAAIVGISRRAARASPQLLDRFARHSSLTLAGIECASGSRRKLGHTSRRRRPRTRSGNWRTTSTA